LLWADYAPTRELSFPSSTCTTARAMSRTDLALSRGLTLRLVAG
jgi:hypothetical protein